MNKSLYGERDYTSGQCILTLRKQLGLTQTGLAFTPDSRSLLSGGEDGSLRLWEAQSGELLRVMQGYTQLLYKLAWSPDGRCLASGTLVQSMLLWDLTTHAQRAMDGKQASLMRHVAWSCDGTRLVGVGDDNHVYVWDARAGTLLFQLAAINASS